MTTQEIREFLQEFLRGAEWRRIREVILCKFDAPYWLLGADGSIIQRVNIDRRYCQLIKTNPEGNRLCQKEFLSNLEMAKTTKNVLLTRCFAKFLGFMSPMIIDDEVIGVIGNCQIVDQDLTHDDYREITTRLGIEHMDFVSLLNPLEALSSKVLEREIGLIHTLCQASIRTVIKARECLHQKRLSLNILKFYKLLDEKKQLLMELELDGLYHLIVEIASKSTDTEVCSLMMAEKGGRELVIKAAIGLPDEVVKYTRVKVGNSISGYVVMTGEPLLVKDVSRDPRFNKKRVLSDRYYTDSVISVPLKMGGTAIGAININNEKSHRLFNEVDLELLEMIAEHTSLAISASSEYQVQRRRDWLRHKTTEEQKEELRLETERLGHQIEQLQMRTQEIARWKAEAERLQLEAKEAEALKKEVAWLRNQAREAREIAEAERLKAKAAALAVQIEDRERQEKLDFYNRQVVTLKLQVDKLKEEESSLTRRIKEGEELLLRAEEAKGLMDERDALRQMIDKMHKEEERLRYQIIEATKLRQRVEEAGLLKAKTEELATLYEISKEIVSIQDTREILPWILEKIMSLIEYQFGVYLLAEDEEAFGEIISHRTVSDSFIKEFKEEIMNNWIDIAPKPQKIDIGARCPELIPGDSQFYEFKWTSSPVLDRGSITGILGIGGFRDDSSFELANRILPIVASHASVAIEKIRIFEETKDAAEHDMLTGLYNFRYFSKAFSAEFKKAIRYNKPLALLMIDLDHLKEFNDTYGHNEGNNLIKYIADLISKSTREVDVLARFGGDEFILLLPESTMENAKNTATRILMDIRSQRYTIKRAPYRISVSIGLASLPDVKAKRPMELFIRADEALYLAKRHGRDQLSIYLDSNTI